MSSRDYDERTYVHIRGANGRCAKWQRRCTFVTMAQTHRLVVSRGSCGCSPTELARVSCSWLGRHSTGAYAGTLWTPTPLHRAKPRAPPSTLFCFSSLLLPPTFHFICVSTVVYHKITVCCRVEFIMFLSINNFDFLFIKYR